ncbi:MAG: DUF2892 domain-containing protein [Deltaproteobacteria bacterium]|nr:DUF2892 domain-containing protein [Deltaproteobacteria bacterium]
MYQSGVETMSPPSDDIRPVELTPSLEVNVGPVERCLCVFAGSALLLSGLRRLSLTRLVWGGALFYRGATGFCPVYKKLESYAGAESKTGLTFEETVTVQRPVEEVYALWRQVENLPRFMSHLEAVTALNEQQSHWVAKIAPPLRLEWDAMIVEDHKNQKISWRSLPGSMIDHMGAVVFHPLPARNATEVKIILQYRPPAGRAGAAVAKLLAGLTERHIREDLRVFKAIMETGEKPTTAGQPSGAAIPQQPVS